MKTVISLLVAVTLVLAGCEQSTSEKKKSPQEETVVLFEETREDSAEYEYRADVPEPGTLAMMVGAAALGLFALRSLRKKS